MPIWLELTVLTLTAYGLGLALGFVLWGGRDNKDNET